MGIFPERESDIFCAIRSDCAVWVGSMIARRCAWTLPIDAVRTRQKTKRSLPIVVILLRRMIKPGDLIFDLRRKTDTVNSISFLQSADSRAYFGYLANGRPGK